VDFELKGVKYRASKLCAMDQGKVYKRLIPCVAALSSLSTQGNLLDTKMDKVAKAVGDMFSQLSDVDYEYCVMNMLKAVQKENGNGTGYSPVVNNSNIMYDEVKDNLVIQLTLVWKALYFNFSECLSALPSDLAGVLSSLKEKLTG
jgi:hypothetical protein